MLETIHSRISVGNQCYQGKFVFGICDMSQGPCKINKENFDLLLHDHFLEIDDISTWIIL